MEQLKKLKQLVKTRQKRAERLIEGLKDLTGLRPPVVQDDCTHVYYVLPLIVDVEKLGTSRESIVQALEAEGVSGLSAGYVNVHLLPMYQEKIAYGSNGFPWTLDGVRQDIDYTKGICPVAEMLHEKTFIGFQMCVHELSDNDIDLIVRAFKKVWENIDSL